MKTLQQEVFIGFVRKVLRYIKRKVFKIYRKVKYSRKEMNSTINYYRNRYRFKAVAHPHKIILVKLEDIKLWLGDDQIMREKYAAGEILDGEWDLNTITIEYAREFFGKWVLEHFKDGVSFEEMGFFRSPYAERRKSVGRGKWARQDRLINYYSDKIDGLYYSMKKNGVLLPSKDRPEIDFMYVHIGRGGELIWTAGGNHRFWIAMCLNIDYIPVRVWLRHKRWQEIRDKLSTRSEQKHEEWVTGYLKHPDLVDISRLQNKMG